MLRSIYPKVAFVRTLLRTVRQEWKLMRLGYPPTRIEYVSEPVGDDQALDPYRWLEGESDEVHQWQARQGEVATAHVRSWPHFEGVRALVDRYTVSALTAVPRFASGKWFREETLEGRTVGRVLIADQPYGSGRVVADVADFQIGNSPAVLSWASPAPNGSVLAIGICNDGSEQNTIRLIDVETRKVRGDAPPHVLHDEFTGGAVWLPDSSGFYYVALTGSVHEFNQAVFLHRLGHAAPTSPEAIPLPADKDYTLIQIAGNGRWAVAVHRGINPIPAAVLNLDDRGAPWRPFMTDVAGTVAGHVIEDRYIAVTDVDAPRGRVVAIPLDSPAPNDPSTWHELVPASNAVLVGITPVQDRMYLMELEDTYGKVRIIDQCGGHIGQVPLPGKGAVELAKYVRPFFLLPPRGHPDEFLFAFSSLTRSSGIYRHRPGEESVEELYPPRVRLDGAHVEDRFASSFDGTRIPYQVMRLDSVGADSPQPTLICAYGGFSDPFMPGFPSSGLLTRGGAAFVAAGGTFVLSHLRGGGEYGREWWEGGRSKNKQNSFADLYAIAEDLIARGDATAELLGLTGASQGGLTTGVAVTQRPDLWKVAVPRAPLLDLIGALRDPYFYWWCDEYADPKDPSEISRMMGFSPYHLVRDGASYPAVLIDAGDTDPRTPPWHARKWAARMQAAQEGDAPILLHIWENVGHGDATARQILVAETAEWLAFVMQHLSMKPVVQ
jgi:prolyl oligopeptidase